MLLPLTFITGFFGMNVDFPGFEGWSAFWALVAIMAVTVFAMLGFFRFKRWL